MHTLHVLESCLHGDNLILCHMTVLRAALLLAKDFQLGCLVEGF